MAEDFLETCLLHWIRSFDEVGKVDGLVVLNDGLSLWNVLQQIDSDYFTGALPEPDVNTSSDWTRKWQNLKHIERQVAMYYRDVCNGQEQMDVGSTPDLKAVAAETSVRDLEKLIMLIIRAAMASPESNQKMAQRLMSLGRENAMVIANELRNMEEADYSESEPVSRDESAYQSEAEIPEGSEKKMNGTRHGSGGMYQDPLLEREEELLRAQATIDKLEASQAAAQSQLQELRQDKERLQEAFDAYRSEIETKGRKTGGDDAFKKLQRQADNDRAYIEDLEGQLLSSRSAIDNYERQSQRLRDESEASQKLRDELQLLKADNEDLNQKIKANENLKKKIQTLQEQEKANVSLREEVKQANEKLEELDKLRQIQAGLEKEIIEKRGLIRNQEYQITELTTTRKHAEYDARVLMQKLQEARDRHDRDHDAIEELRSKLRDSNLDDTTVTQDEPTPLEKDQIATPDPNKQTLSTRPDESKHLSEKLALLEQQLEASDARLKQASERNAALEEKQQGFNDASNSQERSDARLREHEETIAALRKELEGASKAKTDAPAPTQDLAALQRENHLMTTAWYDLSQRLQNNGVSLGRRRQEPKSWIGKQRALVGPQSSMVSHFNFG
jgi:protein HOOK3